MLQAADIRIISFSNSYASKKDVRRYQYMMKSMKTQNLSHMKNKKWNTETVFELGPLISLPLMLQEILCAVALHLYMTNYLCVSCSLQENKLLKHLNVFGISKCTLFLWENDNNPSCCQHQPSEL